MHNLIDREALKRDVRDVVFAVADTPLSNDAMSKLVFQMGELLTKKIDDAPGVDAEPVRHGRWQFEARGKDGRTETPVCSGCGATPKYYVPKNDIGMQVPPYCHECGCKMDKVVKYEAD